MDKRNKREIKRIRHILDEIVSMAEDEEMQRGLGSVIKRYNSVLRHLEESDVLPDGLFQQLSEEEVNFQQAAAESRMLSSYLEDILDEEEEISGKPDFSPVIALAPFLDQGDLKMLIQTHLSGRGFVESHEENSEVRQGPPDLKALVALAPHMASKDLTDLLESCLTREPLSDPKLIVALAPHLDSKDLGRLLRKHASNWFGANEQSEPNQQETPGTSLSTVLRQDPYSEPDVH